MKHGGFQDLESIFLYQEGWWRVEHKQAYGGYRTLQEPSDCFPFQSAHVLSADVLLQFPTLLKVISVLLKSHFCRICLDVAEPDYLTEIIRS